MVPRWAAGLGAIVLWGFVAGWWTPRGPVTTTEALLSIGISLVAGFAAGRLTGSRWAMPLGPVLFATAVELVRIGYAGPTVDHPHASALGLLGLLTGRGVHGLLALLPMLAGAVYGAGAARQAGGLRPGGKIRRGGAGLLAAVVVIVAAVVAVPARTPPIPGGVAELTTVDGLGLLIRGQRAQAPVLLVLAGSPGGSEFGAMRRHLAALEAFFVVVTVDRRGGGNSYGSLDPTSTLTLDDEVRTALAVTRYLRDRFHQDRIYLLAHSGSTVQGVLAVQSHPEFYRAYIGPGPAVDLAVADRAQYADTVAWARRTGDSGLVTRLTAQGPPPYDDIYAYEPMVLAEGGVYAYPGATDSGAGQAENLAVPEHSVLDKVHVFSGFLDTYGVLYPREQDLDLRTRVTRLEVPIYLVAGEHEVPERALLARQWFSGLQAPHKELVTFPGAGHRSIFEQPALVVTLLKRVLAATGN